MHGGSGVVWVRHTNTHHQRAHTQRGTKNRNKHTHNAVAAASVTMYKSSADQRRLPSVKVCQVVLPAFRVVRLSSQPDSQSASQSRKQAAPGFPNEMLLLSQQHRTHMHACTQTLHIKHAAV